MLVCTIFNDNLVVIIIDDNYHRRTLSKMTKIGGYNEFEVRLVLFISKRAHVIIISKKNINTKNLTDKIESKRH